MGHPYRLSRRRLLRALAVGTGGVAFTRFMAPAFLGGAARANVTDLGEAPLFIYAGFQGGWDQLLALDPRDSTQFGAEDGIFPAYDQHGDAGVQASLASTAGTGVITAAGSTATFGPAVSRLTDHASDICVVRGIDMGTLTHEVGTRYFLTGKFPRGLSANGSAMTTAIASSTGDLCAIPNLVVGMETYNEGEPAFASGLQVNRSSDLLGVLYRIGEPLPDAARAAIDDYVWSESCANQGLDGTGLVTTFLDSREKAAILASGELAQHFLFTESPSSAVSEVYQHFGIVPGGVAFNRDLSGPKGQAAIAAQALTHGVCQCVSINLATSIDHHDDDYLTDHAPALREGFEALADLVDWLKTHMDAGGNPLWDRTTILVSSDFARTPKLNSRGGRDHHIASSCLVMGPGIQGGQAIGGTTDTTMAVQPVDLDTGAVVASGSTYLRPPDIHATVLSSMGLSHDHLSNQAPQIIGAMLKS